MADTHNTCSGLNNGIRRYQILISGNYKCDSIWQRPHWCDWVLALKSRDDPGLPRWTQNAITCHACSVAWVMSDSCDPMDCSPIPPGSSVHGILQAKNTGVGCHVFLLGIFPTQGLKPCLLSLLHGRWILYCWVTGESPNITTRSLKKQSRGRRGTDREGKAVRHGGQSGVMQPQGKEGRQPQMLKESTLKGVGPCGHLDFCRLMSTSDFRPPELTENQFLIFVVICYCGSYVTTSQVT